MIELVQGKTCKGIATKTQRHKGKNKIKVESKKIKVPSPPFYLLSFIFYLFGALVPWRRVIKPAIIAAMIGTLGVFTALGLLRAEEDYMSALGIQKFEERREAPKFALKNLKGQEVRLEDYRGKVVLLNFMATWCHWCRKEMPSLQKLHTEFKNRDFALVAVFSDRGGAEVVGPFVTTLPYE